MVNNRLAIVVLNWNSADDSVKCMESLAAQKHVVPDIILVDNDSHDNSIEILERFIKKSGHAIHFIKNGVNSGFTGSNNVG